MTPAQYLAIRSNPLSATNWRIADLTPAQYAGILAAIAALPPPATTPHVETGGNAPTATYQAADGGGIVGIQGRDSAGVVSLTTGVGVPGASALVSVLFDAAFTSAPTVLVEDMLGNLDGKSPTLAVTNTGFTLSLAQITAGTAMQIAWHAIGSPS